MWKIKLLWLIAVAVSLTACLHDDLAECDQGIELVFGYTHHNYEADLFGAEVEQVSVYAFDQSGHFMGVYTGNVGTERNDYIMSLPLEKGEYTLVVLGGSLESYQVGASGGQSRIEPGLQEKLSRLDHFRVLLQTDVSAGEILSGMHPSELFYGRKSIEVVSGKWSSYKVDLIKNSSAVRVRINETTHTDLAGVRSEGTECPYEIYLSGNNTMLDSENMITEDAPVYRHSLITIGNDPGASSYQIDYRMMRLMMEHPVQIKIEDRASGDVLLEEELLALILDNKSKYSNQSDLDKEDDFLIEVNVTRNLPGGKTGVTVSVNGWTITKIRPEF